MPDRPSPVPLQLLWYQRTVTEPLVGITRITVPLAGGPPDLDAAECLERELLRRWVTPAAGRPCATSVAVSIHPEPNRPGLTRHLLVLVIIASRPSCAELHPARLARHLRGSLNLLSFGPGTAPRPTVRPVVPTVLAEQLSARHKASMQVARGAR